MASARHKVHVARPPSAVWAYITDFERGPEWMRGLAAVRVPSGPVGLGARVTEVRRVPGRTVEAVVEVVEWEPPRRLRKRSVGGALRADGTYALTPRGDGTELAFALDIEGTGAARLLAWLLGRTLQRDTEAELSALKRIVEGLPDHPAPI